MAVLAEQLKGNKDDNAKSDDRSNAIIGLKMEPDYAQDNDMDFEGHWMNFQACLDMHSFGRHAQFWQEGGASD